MAVKLKDVAEKAGVSLSTVSHILNKRKDCYAGEATRKRVMDAVKELNYRPHYMAKSLVSGKTNLIGLVIPSIANVFFPEIIRGVEEELKEKGYKVILCHSNESSEQEKEEIEMLMSMRVDGIIISPTFEVDKDNSIFEQLQKEKIPFVTINGHPENIDCNYVIGDDKTGAIDAINYLVKKGHQRIAFIKGEARSKPGRERLEGYKESLAHNKITFDEELLIDYDLAAADRFDIISKLLASKEPPTAIITTAILYGLDALKCAQKLGIKLPEELTLMTFGGEELLELVNIPMTFISQHSREIGRKAGEVLIKEIKAGNGKEKQQVRIKADIVSA